MIVCDIWQPIMADRQRLEVRSGVFDQRFEAVVHVLLHVTVAERRAGIVGDEIHLHRRVAWDIDRVWSENRIHT
jgi:hypothetical protein